MTLYEQSVPQLRRMLNNLTRWLDKAEAHAKQKGFDPAVLLHARLAPDQFHLIRQVQIACDAAKNGCAHLTGKEPPAHADTEQTLDEVRARIAKCIAYLDTITPADFEGAEGRTVTMPAFKGQHQRVAAHLHEYTLPNFYFHVVTAYAILRHNGVDVGKMDYLAGLTFVPA